MKRHIAIALAAVLAAALAFSATACSKADVPAVTPEITDAQTSLPTAEPTVEPTPEPVPNGTHFLINTAFDKPGEIVLTEELVLELLESADPEAAQSVWIIARYYPGAADFAYNGRTYAEYRSDPALVSFEAEYRDWMRDTYLARFVEMTEKARSGDGEAAEWLARTASDIFFDEWSARVSEDAVSAYNEAYSNYRAAKKALQCEDDPAAARAALDDELARLKELGFELELKYEPGENAMAFDLYGELTLEKLFGLAADPDWAYCIYPWPLDQMHG
ncbi:MAG: hypothetical protein J5772_02070 [Clostridia bacterium]|nr:hypothetical protein [Clostridia bacterium]